MQKIMGPVLGFRGAGDEKWRLSALLVTEGNGAPGNLVIEDDGSPREADEPVRLKTLAGKKVWRYDFEVPRTARARKLTYTLSGSQEKYSFVVPALGAPQRFAYASCNGFSDPRDMKKVDDKNGRWKHMARKHRARPYHLLLMGGDQVYADTIWETVPSMKAWVEERAATRNKAKFTPAMRQQVEAFYMDLYCSRWSQPESARMFASIPSLMMWDDHDIFDGWGSYGKKEQGSAVYQGIFGIAREYFTVFQQRVKPGAQPAGALCKKGNFTYLHCLGDIALLALDMRSERSQAQVLSDKSWRAIYAELDSLKGCKHLLVLSSIPVVHPDFSLVESIFGIIPGRQSLEDDLKDHWHSRTHKAERLRLIHRLLKFADTKDTRVTLLSGDVHVGAVGAIESRRAGAKASHANVINQLTSSGIVHPAPPALMSYALEHLSRNPEQVDRGITASMLEFHGMRRRFIMARNWLGLEPDRAGRIWANWYVEGEDAPYTKVIHTV
ncbi:MAG: alkaline phosphatase D family protein [Alphaproteobacteria bacterium]